MKPIIIAAIAAAALGGVAQAQSATPDAAHSGSGNAAVKDSSVAQAKVAADGANSFTEKQARDRISKAGYTQVGTLAKDKSGVWRGTATKAGKSMAVGLDYKGNVTAN
jgi:hypothetical protein